MCSRSLGQLPNHTTLARFRIACQTNYVVGP